uniref:Uncharacterized protein n=1 Tax=viral metagenome TaxID=1070528 RepID=A0A6C0CE34_9ZZZZ
MQRRRTGGEASYPPLGDYTLVQSAPSTVSSQPALKGGNNGCPSCQTGGGDPRRRGGYYYADQKPSAVSPHVVAQQPVVKGGNDRRRRGGAPVELTAFISALALLGARLLADKNSSFNFFSEGQEERAEPMYQEQVGGRRRRAPAKPVRKARRVI